MNTKTYYVLKGTELATGRVEYKSADGWTEDLDCAAPRLYTSLRDIQNKIAYFTGQFVDYNTGKPRYQFECIPVSLQIQTV